ncbi:GDP-L-fucose synthase [Roseovarius litorisediminis]|uniref:GDP-L-fucose synthase n=1 Tax=Roseovarius litorisediminis TaxID=1312363 RepID=A0A1Y5RS98_9RHOB|nr:GDP-L-fucose synthase [Roseovarius litorisediminis]SLN24201.1 GDP-L-fucose synthase [Roseovarius litorisediminis]
MAEAYSLNGKRVYVAGHRGMVGSAIMRRLAQEGCEVLTASRAEADLTRQAEVEAWFETHKPDAVFVAAAKVGGILANDSYPADFLYENLMIEANVIHAAYRTGVEKLMFLGSSCIYPKMAPQPISEDALLTGPLEPTNEWYAIAKIAGIKLCQAYRRQHGADFISAMPTNLYGTGDNYDLKTSHVLPALVRKVVEAREAGADEIEIWGTGSPLREFMHADDLADALIFLMKTYSDAEHVNVGSGQEVTIRALAEMIVAAAGYKGRIVHDTTKPDGTPRKLMDSERLLSMGWRPQISLEEGLARTIREFETSR